MVNSNRLLLNAIPIKSAYYEIKWPETSQSSLMPQHDGPHLARIVEMDKFLIPVSNSKFSIPAVLALNMAHNSLATTSIHGTLLI